MSKLFRRHSTVSCFFCQQTVTPPPRDLRSFKCPQCTCWNRYDTRGEIMSDEPAMHDEALNTKSFARRASPSKDRLPTMYGNSNSIFCHTCQTNQMLLTNLLSNYLPPPEHPEYERRLEMLPDYRTALHERYPPVCEDCLPAVEEEIRSKDHMARTRALGGWLKQSKGKEKERKVSGSSKHGEKRVVELFAWKVRGCLWVVTLVLALAGDAALALGYNIPSLLDHGRPILPYLMILSLLWTVWDPTYAAQHRAKIQGRDVRVQGKKTYIVLQMVSWLLRFTTTTLFAITQPDYKFIYLSYNTPSTQTRIYFFIMFVVETSLVIASCSILRLKQPPVIRLLNTTTHRFPTDPEFTRSRSSSARSSPAPSQSAEPDLLASLSLSSNPVLSTAPRSVFGLPSLVPTSYAKSSDNRMDENDNTDANEMDWTPTDPSVALARRNARNSVVVERDDGSLIRKQRFFPPEQPTGLEGLFARTLLVDDTWKHSSSNARDSSRIPPKLQWWILIGVLLIPVLGISYKIWGRWDVLITRSESNMYAVPEPSYHAPTFYEDKKWE